MEKQPKRIVCVRLHGEFLNEIDELARRRRLSRTALVADALERLLNLQGERRGQRREARGA